VTSYMCDKYGDTPDKFIEYYKDHEAVLELTQNISRYLVFLLKEGDQ